MTRLWHKGAPLDEMVLRFTVGNDHILDARLVSYDVRASIAHAQMLCERGYLSADELSAICRELRTLSAEHDEGLWSIALEEEDVHTALENRLTERVGEAGRRLHLGRSRNDQVLAALRLYLLDAIDMLSALGRNVMSALEQVMQQQGEIPLPGYTHQQRAMPSSVALWAGGFRAEIGDDLEGLNAARRRLDKNPLGSAAGYGVPVLNLDRQRTTELLDFTETHDPVTAVQLSRGKGEAALVFELSLLMQDVGRLAADVCLFATSEFAFVALPAEMTTGSSIMPQKRNPDVFELIRARAARYPAFVQAITGITSRLTSGYHRDLQLIKEPLFDALDAAAQTLQMTAHAMSGVRFVPAHTSAAMDPSLYATEQACNLVKSEGIPFRDAYRRIAEDLASEEIP